MGSMGLCGDKGERIIAALNRTPWEGSAKNLSVSLTTVAPFFSDSSHVDGPRRLLAPAREEEEAGSPHRYTIGAIIWFGMLRLVLTIFAAWYLREFVVHDQLSYSEWWGFTIVAIYGVAIYPAQIQYRWFQRNSRRIVEGTLCSSCRYFNPDNLHCTQLDEHVSETYLPCEGEGWQPHAFAEAVEDE